MGSKNGISNNPRGRPKGSMSKDVRLIREAVHNLLEMSAPKMQGWLNDIAASSPKYAMKCVTELLEYSLPKLQRTEMQNLDADGQPADAPAPRIVIEHVKSDIKKD